MITDEVKEKLKEEIEFDVLGQYNLPSGHVGLTKIIDTWANNKASLIELLSKHPNWKPDKFQIAFDTTVDREIDRSAVVKFFTKVYDYKKGSKWTDTLDYLSEYAAKDVNEKLANYAAKDYPELKIVKGQKTSKAVNKILIHLEIDKLMGTYTERGKVKKVYDREYADYSNAINPLQIIRHTVISVNPVDYLLASNGNSWSSCHTIDKHNPNGYSGCRCSGTLSYMLDGTSMVFYHVDESYTGDELELQPKIIRQMFHYENGILIQGRLYPQCNDGKNSLYVPTRAIIQHIIAECLGLPNLWRKKGGTSVCSSYVNSYGTHYRDYTNQSECNVSRIIDLIPEGEDSRKVNIGHKPICPVCGKEHTYEGQLYCGYCNRDGDEDTYYCASCGDAIDPDDIRWVGDEPYCCDCASWCNECETYEVASEVRYLEEYDRYVCSGCLSEYYTYCDCGHYVRDANDTEIEDIHGNTWCPSCASEHLTEIDGEYYPNDEVKTCPICGTVHVEEGEFCRECVEEAEHER